jgi:hypothetical protein
MLFNKFLSASKDRKIALCFIHSDQFGILFSMIIDRSLSSTPFASINTSNYHQTLEEVKLLFSTHSIIRIDQIKQIDNHACRWQVELTLTNGQQSTVQRSYRANTRRHITNCKRWYIYTEYTVDKIRSL